MNFLIVLCLFLIVHLFIALDFSVCNHVLFVFFIGIALNLQINLERSDCGSYKVVPLRFCFKMGLAD